MNERFYLARFMRGDDQEHSDVFYVDNDEEARVEAVGFYEAEFGPVPLGYRLEISGPFETNWRE